MHMIPRSILCAVFALSILVLPSPAWADATGIIQSVGPLGGGTVVNVVLTGSPALCTSVTSGPLALGDLRVGNGGVTADSMKAILATLLAAKLSVANVTIYASNGTAASFGCIVTGAVLN